MDGCRVCGRVKHGINAFLALSISFANELAGIGERVGADVAEVERGLKTESRSASRVPQAGPHLPEAHWPETSRT